MAANTAREKIKSSSDEDKWDPNSAFDRYVKVCYIPYVMIQRVNWICKFIISVIASS